MIVKVQRKLHNSYKDFFLNCDKILSLEPMGDYTRVETIGGGSFHIMESCEELQEMINILKIKLKSF